MNGICRRTGNFGVRAAVVVWAALVVLLACGAASAKEPARFTQYSTLGALLSGGYEGFADFGQVLAHGGYGLGTLDALDGELICLESKCYQIKADGVVHKVAKEATTPFVQIAPFVPAVSMELKNLAALADVEKALSAKLPSPNLFAMAVLRGSFDLVKTRSVPRQKQPYPPLGEVVKTQTLFKFESVTGTVVAVYQPAYVGQMGVPGWHMHFLNASRTAGGHVLDLVPRKVTAEIETFTDFNLILPASGDFLKLDLDLKQTNSIDSIERFTPREALQNK